MACRLLHPSVLSNGVQPVLVVNEMILPAVNTFRPYRKFNVKFILQGLENYSATPYPGLNYTFHSDLVETFEHGIFSYRFV